MAGKKRPMGRPWEPLQPARVTPTTAQLKALRDAREPAPSAVWMNDKYTVLVNELPGGLTHLSIRRNDREWPRDWRHFQRIKNEICGPEREGCELYPAESRMLDAANQFHLWVLPTGVRFPFGYDSGRQVADQDDPRLPAGVAGKQRPLDEVS